MLLPATSDRIAQNTRQILSKHIIVFTARQTKGSGKARNHRSWITNGAGFKHSTQYGFGLLDAWRLVNAAKIWKRVPILTSFSPPTIGYNEKIPKQNEQSAQMGTLRLSATVSARDAEEHKINTLEHVQITLTIEHGRRGDVEVIIACPSGKNLYFRSTSGLSITLRPTSGLVVVHL